MQIISIRWEYLNPYNYVKIMTLCQVLSGGKQRQINNYVQIICIW